jgi:hypothetical protein
MILQAAMLAGMMAVMGDDPPPVRQDRPIAVWFAPEVDFELTSGLLPLGLQAAVQVYGPFCLTAGGNWLPVANVERKQGTAGARWYLKDALIAPYLSADVGWARQGIDDTGGQIRKHFFAFAGVGLEVAKRGGFSLIVDLALGPDHVSDYSVDTWRFAGRFRVGIGYRF